MSNSLGNSNRNSQASFDRISRTDRGRNVRYRAGRIIRGESPRNFLSNDAVTQGFKRVLHETYEGEQAPTHAVAEDAGQSKKAAENWWSGENPMGSTAFINAYRNNPRFAAFARFYLLGHTDRDPILDIHMHEVASNLEQAAQRMGMHPQQLAGAMQFAMTNKQAPDDAETGAAKTDAATGDLFGESN